MTADRRTTGRTHQLDPPVSPTHWLGAPAESPQVTLDIRQYRSSVGDWKYRAIGSIVKPDLVLPLVQDLGVAPSRSRLGRHEAGAEQQMMRWWRTARATGEHNRRGRFQTAPVDAVRRYAAAP